jgi:hypothetical protein
MDIYEFFKKKFIIGCHIIWLFQNEYWLYDTQKVDIENYKLLIYFIKLLKLDIQIYNTNFIFNLINTLTTYLALYLGEEEISLLKNLKDMNYNIINGSMIQFDSDYYKIIFYMEKYNYPYKEDFQILVIENLQNNSSKTNRNINVNRLEESLSVNKLGNINVNRLGAPLSSNKLGAPLLVNELGNTNVNRLGAPLSVNELGNTNVNRLGAPLSVNVLGNINVNRLGAPLSVNLTGKSLSSNKLGATLSSNVLEEPLLVNVKKTRRRNFIFKKISTSDIDRVIIIDKDNIISVMMPNMSTEQYCQYFRRFQQHLPIKLINNIDKCFYIILDIIIFLSDKKINTDIYILLINKIKEILITKYEYRIDETNYLYLYNFWCDISIIIAILYIGYFQESVKILNLIFTDKYALLLRGFQKRLINKRYNNWTFLPETSAIINSKKLPMTKIILENIIKKVIKISDPEEYINILKLITFINSSIKISKANKDFFINELKRYIPSNIEELLPIPPLLDINYEKYNFFFKKKEYNKCLIALIGKDIKFNENIKTSFVNTKTSNIITKLNNYAKSVDFQINKSTLNLLKTNINPNILREPLFEVELKELIQKQQKTPKQPEKINTPKWQQPSVTSVGSVEVSNSKNIRFTNKSKNIKQTTISQKDVMTITQKFKKDASKDYIVSKKYFDQFLLEIRGKNDFDETLFKINSKRTVRVTKDLTNLYIKILYDGKQICHTSFHCSIPGNYRFHIKLDILDALKSYEIKCIYHQRTNGVKSGLLIIRVDDIHVDNQPLFDLIKNISQLILNTIIGCENPE